MSNKPKINNKILEAMARDDFIELLKIASYADPKNSLGKVMASIFGNLKMDINLAKNQDLLNAVKDFIEKEAYKNKTSKGK